MSGYISQKLVTLVPDSQTLLLSNIKVYLTGHLSLLLEINFQPLRDLVRSSLAVPGSYTWNII